MTKLKAYLHQNGIKLVWLAERVGMSYDRLQRITNGRSEALVGEARAIANELKQPEEVLFDVPARTVVAGHQ
jgi:hypothetical protein